MAPSKDEPRAQLCEACRREWASLRHLLDATPDAIGIHRARKLVYVNPAAVALFGLSSQEEVLGRSPLEFVAPGYRGIVADRIFTTYMRRADTPLIEEKLVHASGAEIPVDVVAIPILFEGEPATLVHIRDLSAKKEIEVKLRAADRLASVGLVAAGVAHEINTPLTYAMGSLDLLAARLAERGDDAELRDAVAAARDGVERAAKVVRDVRVLSRNEPRASESVDVHAVLDSCASLVARDLSARATLVKQYGAVPRVRGSAGRLGQVFLNLLANAIDATPPGRPREHTITLRTFERGDGSVAVEVCDTGAGVPPELRKAIFDPLFTTKAEGTGLGLAICRTLLAEDGGALELESEPGRGACFRAVLRRGEPARPAAPPPRAAHADGMRILVVDDEPRLARTVQLLLSEYTTQIALGGAAAVDLLRRDPSFDVVLCDLRMNGIDGIDLYEKIRVEQPGLERRIVFMTGGTTSARADDFLQAVPNPILEKPFGTRELHEAIARALEAADQRG